jgi:hypothetical protein
MMLTMDVRIDADAAEYTKAKEGVIFIWSSDAGLLHVSEKPPNNSADWETVPVEEIEVRIAPWLAAIESWHVALRRFPRKALVATSDFTRSPVQDLWGSGL